VKAEVDASMPRGAATVIVRTTDGKQHSATVHHPRGSEQHPLTDAEIETKTRENCALGRSGVDPGPVIAAVWNLDRAGSVQALTQAVTGRG
jgi:2-methylcitrate dehydratase PrpD